MSHVAIAMNGKFTLFGRMLEIVATVLVLLLCLFGDSHISGTNGVIGSILRELPVIFRDPGTQWMVFLCVAVNLLTFLLLQCRINGLSFWHAANPNLWLTGMLLLGTLVYAFNYSAAAQSTQGLILLAGTTLGQGLALCSEGNAYKKKNWIYLIIATLLLLLSFSLLEHTNAGSVQNQYRGQLRWVGPWDNPNIYGLLMGVGIVLAIGMAVSSFKFQVFRESIAGSWKSGVKGYAVIVVCLIAAILMGRGLLHSYSRGAWLAASCGLAYLVNRVFSFQFSQASPQASVFALLRRDKPPRRAVFSQWLRRNAPVLAIIVLSLCALAFWQFRQTDRIIARRAISIGNMNDFSWRNRFSAWEGALQITAEHPALGAGWNQPEVLYENYYSLPKVDESAAIQLNDYLMLGATLGVPALICFGAYLCLSLTRSRFGVPPLGGPTPKPRERGTPNEDCSQTSHSDFGLFTPDFLPVVCRAGAIVLLVGFWFDGGLFGLPTAATFWILLELGASRLTPTKIAVPS